MRKASQSGCYHAFLNPQELQDPKHNTSSMGTSVAPSKHWGLDQLLRPLAEFLHIWILCHLTLSSLQALEPLSLAQGLARMGPPYMLQRGSHDYRMFYHRKLQGRWWGGRGLRARPLRRGKWRLGNIGKSQGIKTRWYSFLLLSQYHSSVYSEKQPAAAPK